jgi:hypothetical protein
MRSFSRRNAGHGKRSDRIRGAPNKKSHREVAQMARIRERSMIRSPDSASKLGAALGGALVIGRAVELPVSSPRENLRP